MIVRQHTKYSINTHIHSRYSRNMSSRRTRAAPTPSVPARVGHQAYAPPQQQAQYGQSPYAPQQPQYVQNPYPQQQAQYGQPIPPNYGQSPYSHPPVQYTPTNATPYGQGQQPYGQPQGAPSGQPSFPSGQPSFPSGQPSFPSGQISPQTGNPQFSLPEIISIVDQRLVVLEAFMSRFNEMEAQVLPDSINLILRAARDLSQGHQTEPTLDGQDIQV